MQIELAYIFADQQNILVLELSQGTTIAQVLTNLPDPDAYTSACAVGIFGRIRSKNWIVQEGDRVEIYRPLLVDPKAARLARAKKQKKSNF